MASRKAWPELRNVSLKRQISTPCWLRKCSSFLPALRQHSSRRGAGLYSVLFSYGVLHIFGHEENPGLQDSPRAGCPCREGGDGCEETTSHLHTCLEGKAIEEIGDFLEWVGGDHQDGGCGFSGLGFLHSRLLSFFTSLQPVERLLWVLAQAS